MLFSSRTFYDLKPLHLVKDDPDPAKALYDVYLVTNRHVIQEHAVALALEKAERPELPVDPTKPASPEKEDSISVRMNE